MGAPSISNVLSPSVVGGDCRVFARYSSREKSARAGTLLTVQNTYKVDCYRHLLQTLCPRPYTAEPDRTRQIVSRRHQLCEVVAGDPR